MASIPCSIQLILPSTVYTSSSSSSGSSSFSSFSKLTSQFLGIRKKLGWFRASRISSKIGPSTGSRAKCWFKFGKNGVDAEGAGIYGSQSREDFDRDDVEQYFNYMGMLAVEGTYEKMEALLSQNIHPVDILLMMAASEGDKPKIEELLRAGASYTVKDADGRTAVDRAVSDEIKELILGFSVQKT
ncbi:protein LHCP TRANSLOCATION DEFECT [Macadamia integrifolia]|uniref:protein LHCP TRANSLOCATION DEFECT n=1 Tax=Macadamia integrifolia TaxID=60698 RepID=UPI001C4FCFC7|nr:protein LHCP TRANSLOCATION DEFECT [Macadamia integrifolia]